MRVDLLKFPARGAERRGGRGTNVRPMDDIVVGAPRARESNGGADDSIPAHDAARFIITADTQFAATHQLLDRAGGRRSIGRRGYDDQSLHGLGGDRGAF